MSVEFTFDGLDELKQALMDLPASLSQEGGDIVVVATNDTADAIVAAYPEGPTGHLKGGVRFTVERSPFGALGTIKNTAQHAWIFEEGTQARHYVTKNGVQHLTGSMPPSHVFVRTIMAGRKTMYEQLSDLLKAQGLEVSDDGA